MYGHTLPILWPCIHFVFIQCHQICFLKLLEPKITILMTVVLILGGGSLWRSPSQIQASALWPSGSRKIIRR